MIEEKKVQQRVGYDDVLDALTKDKEGNLLDEPISPFDTNAGRVRSIIGYGSNGTIQKHLDAMRDDINKKRLNDVETTEAVTPRPPRELIDSIWSAAWTTAQVATLSRIEKLTIERDGLQQKASAQANDITELTDKVDEQQDIIASNSEALEQYKAEQEADLYTINSEKEELQLQLEIAQKAVNDASLLNDQIKSDALHEKELMLRDAEIARATMQSTIDHLNDTVSELKAMRIASK